MSVRRIVIVLGILVLTALGYFVLFSAPPVDISPTADTGSESIVVDDHLDDILVIEIAGEGAGIIEILLRPDVAPLHVAQIKALARSGAYDGIAFHRVIDGFMAQTGDVQFGSAEDYQVNMVGSGGSDLPDIPAEFSDLMFVEGIVGMARSSAPNSANSQFFIMFTEYPSLDGNYTVIGRVIAGMEFVAAIKRGDSAANGSVFEQPDYMSSVKIKSDM